MGSDLKIDSIIDKINLILERNLKLEEEVNSLKKKITELENNRKLLEEGNLGMKSEVKRLKMAKSVDITEEERTDMKKELKQYIKEIDKCLALLNK